MNSKGFRKIYEYIHQLFSKEDEILKSVNQSTIRNFLPQIGIRPNQGKFLQMLVMLSKAKNILEIGTLAGYSAIWMARALPPDGKLITIELNPKHAKVAEKNFQSAGLADKIKVRVGEALEVLEEMERENIGDFDMIFIDAHKPDYPKYLEKVIKFSHSGTVIAADNVIRRGEVLNKKSKVDRVVGIQKFNQMLSDRDDVIATIIPNISRSGFDGIAVVIVK